MSSEGEGTVYDRIEKLENWKAKAQKSATIVKKTLDAKND